MSHLLQREFWQKLLAPVPTGAQAQSVSGRDRFTLDELRNLYDVLSKNPVVNEANRATVVETIRSIAEFMIWGDQNEPRVFEFFLEHNVMAYLHRVLLQPANRSGDVAKQVLQTLSIIIQNISSETGTFFLFSNDHVNNIIEIAFDFEHEEVLGFYISLLKAISLKLNLRTAQFFVRVDDSNRVASFPLYSAASRFAHHKEGMVRAGVRTMFLHIFSVADPYIDTYVTQPSATHYLANVAHYLATHVQVLDKRMQAAEGFGAQALSSLDSQLAEVEDILSYSSDVLSAGHPYVAHLLAQQLWSVVIGPLLLASLLEQPSDPLQGAGPTNIRPACALYVLERILALVTYPPLLNNLLLALFGRSTVPGAAAGAASDGAEGSCREASGCTGVQGVVAFVEGLNSASQGHDSSEHYSSCREGFVAAMHTSGLHAANNALRALVALTKGSSSSSSGAASPALLCALGLLPRSRMAALRAAGATGGGTGCAVCDLAALLTAERQQGHPVDAAGHLSSKAQAGPFAFVYSLVWSSFALPTLPAVEPHHDENHQREQQGDAASASHDWRAEGQHDAVSAPAVGAPPSQEGDLISLDDEAAEVQSSASARVAPGPAGPSPAPGTLEAEPEVCSLEAAGPASAAAPRPAPVPDLLDSWPAAVPQLQEPLSVATPDLLDSEPVAAALPAGPYPAAALDLLDSVLPAAAATAAATPVVPLPAALPDLLDSGLAAPPAVVVAAPDLLPGGSAAAAAAPASQAATAAAVLVEDTLSAAAGLGPDAPCITPPQASESSEAPFINRDNKSGPEESTSEEGTPEEATPSPSSSVERIANTVDDSAAAQQEAAPLPPAPPAAPAPPPPAPPPPAPADASTTTDEEDEAEGKDAGHSMEVPFDASDDAGAHQGGSLLDEDLLDASSAQTGDATAAAAAAAVPGPHQDARARVEAAESDDALSLEQSTSMPSNVDLLGLDARAATPGVQASVSEALAGSGVSAGDSDERSSSSEGGAGHAEPAQVGPGPATLQQAGDGAEGGGNQHAAARSVDTHASSEQGLAAGHVVSTTPHIPAPHPLPSGQAEDILDALFAMLSVPLLPMAGLWNAVYLIGQFCSPSHLSSDVSNPATTTLPAGLSPEHQRQLQCSLDEAASRVLDEISCMWCDAIFPLICLDWALAADAVSRPILRSSADVLMASPALYPPRADGSTVGSPPGATSAVGRQNAAAVAQMMGLSSSASAALHVYHSVQRLVAMLQLKQLLQQGKVSRSPPLPTPPEWEQRHHDSGEGQQVDLQPTSAIPCIVSFQPGQERRVYFSLAGAALNLVADYVAGAAVTEDPDALATILHTSAAIVLADPAPTKLNAGIVAAASPLMGAEAMVDKKVSKWVHVHVRPSVRGLLRVLRSIPGKKGGVLGAMRQLADGHWVLAFPDGERSAAACKMVKQQADQLRSLYADLLGPFIS